MSASKPITASTKFIETAFSLFYTVPSFSTQKFTLAPVLKDKVEFDS
jgi:hypothetical protein